MPISPRMICPALMLAASRKDRVIGRTAMLVVSIRARKGFNQAGAPPGKRDAINDVGVFEMALRISLSHIGRARIRVRKRCLEALNI